MSLTKGRTIVGWILRVLLAAVFLLAAAGKLSGAAIPMFAGWGYAAWFATLIGMLELAGAIGLLIPRTMRPAILGLSIVMLGAAYTHLAAGEGPQVIRPLVFLAVLWSTWFLRAATPVPISPSVASA